MNIKETIRAEIERRKKENMSVDLPMSIGRYYEDRDLLAFIDSLPEQPVIKKSNALFDKCVENCDPAIMKEVSDNIDKILGRQPVEGMEEAFEKEFEKFSNDPDAGDYALPIDLSDYKDFAHHFAEWGAAHLKK